MRIFIFGGTIRFNYVTVDPAELAWKDDAEVHSMEHSLVPCTLHRFKALTLEGKPFEVISGIRMSTSEWNTVCDTRDMKAESVSVTQMRGWIYSSW